MNPQRIFHRQFKSTRGWTLVELAIVLSIIGLLIGGMLRGLDLMQSAKVRQLVSQKTSVQAAYYGFVDRFRVQPGDLTTEQALLINTQATPAFVGAGDGWIQWQDSPQFFNNLMQAGFLSCPQCAPRLTSVPTEISTTNSPTNLYGAPIWYESAQGGSAAGGSYITPIGTIGTIRGKLSTGSAVDADLLAEMDRKIDDGNPSQGSFRASNWSWTAIAPLSACIDITTNNAWVVDSEGQCQGVTLM